LPCGTKQSSSPGYRYLEAEGVATSTGPPKAVLGTWVRVKLAPAKVPLTPPLGADVLPWDVDELPCGADELAAGFAL